MTKLNLDQMVDIANTFPVTSIAGDMLLDMITELKAARAFRDSLKCGSAAVSFLTDANDLLLEAWDEVRNASS